MRLSDYTTLFISQRLAVIGAFRSTHSSIVVVFPQWSAVVPFSGSCVCFFYRGHPCFKNFNSTIPVGVTCIRVKSVRILINELDVVPYWIVTGCMGMFSLLIKILTCTHIGSYNSAQDFTPVTSGIVELKFLKQACPQ